jgi:DNA repair photolyase
VNLKIREIIVKSVITKSKIPGIDYVINPYRGCSHACIYCYARIMDKFRGLDDPWGSFVDVKINSLDLIPIKSEKYVNKSIFLSSVTDPYLWLENKYKLTRKILEKLIPLQPNLLILTKSALVERDIDLFKQFKNCEVGFTFTTHDERTAREIEPLASSPLARIRALRALSKSGIKTYVFIAPIIPFITDWKKIIEQTAWYSDYYGFDKLNLKGDIAGVFGQWLSCKRPELLVKYKELYFSPNNYWSVLRKELDFYCKQNNLDCRIFIPSK